MASPITALALSPSSTQLAIATSSTLNLTFPPTPNPSTPLNVKPQTTLQIPNVISLSLPSSSTLYTATTTGNITRYSTNPFSEDFSIKAAHSTHPLTSIAALSPTTPFVTAAKDGLLKLWDPATTATTAKFSGHRYEVRAVALASSVDNDTPITLIASAGRDKTVRLWDSRTHNPIAVLKAHSGWVHSVALASSPSPIAVSCAGDKTVRVWDLLTMTQRHVFTGHEYRVWDVAVPSNAKYCVSASTDATVRAWQIDGPGRHTFDAHNDSVLCLAAARDGRFIVSGCEDGTVLVWHSQGLFGHQPNAGDIVEEHPTPVVDNLPVEELKTVKEEAALVDVAPHVAKPFHGVPKQMDTTPLVPEDGTEENHSQEPEQSFAAGFQPTSNEQSSASPRRKKSPMYKKSNEPPHKEDTESLKAVIATQPEQAPSYDKSAAELVKALQRINELEKSLRDANHAAATKDRELSALKSSLTERDATITKLQSEVEASKTLVHEASVRALLDANPRKADIALDYDEPVNKIGAVSDKLTRLAARLDAMIATN